MRAIDQEGVAAGGGVHEVEVDFNSAQASVLFDQSATTVTKLTEIVGAVGYRVLGVTQADAK